MADNKEKQDRLKALDAAISQIEKQYGRGSVMKLGESSSELKVETVPTGSLSLDIALGQGGLPKGRIDFFSGVSGKNRADRLEIDPEDPKVGQISPHHTKRHHRDAVKTTVHRRLADRSHQPPDGLCGKHTQMCLQGHTVILHLLFIIPFYY